MNSKPLALVIAIGWLFAAVTLFLAGKWAGETNRYDGCEYVAYMGAYFCPVNDPEKPPAKGAEA